MPPLEKVELRKNTTPTVQGASVLDNAFSREHMNLYWITLRGNVAPGNKTTPDKINQYMVVVVL